jgi:hypothetical protein
VEELELSNPESEPEKDTEPDEEVCFTPDGESASFIPPELYPDLLLVLVLEFIILLFSEEEEGVYPPSVDVPGLLFLIEPAALEAVE